MKYIFIISLPLYLIDQGTKAAILRLIEPGGYKTIIQGFFELVSVTNTGAAFGSFKGNNNFFIALSCLALLVVVTLLVRHHARDFWRDLSLALLLAGIFGNLTDRLLHQHVIDFLLFDFGPSAPSFLHPWPAFNVADSCICIAVICFVIHSFFPKGIVAEQELAQSHTPGEGPHS